MALIDCWECYEEISNKAKSCPHCGAGKAIECHECSNIISKGLNKCPHCGAPEGRVIKINKPIKILFWFSLFGTSLLFAAYPLIALVRGFLFSFSTWSFICLVCFGICIPVAIFSFKRLYKSIKEKRNVNVKIFDFIWNKRRRNITIITTIAIIITTFMGSVIYSTRPTVCNCINQAKMNSSISDECIVILSDKGIDFKNKNELERYEYNRGVRCE
jgi:RNA polymerase subunit RPABC4/transcription elongation factor Spt4